MYWTPLCPWKFIKRGMILSVLLTGHYRGAICTISSLLQPSLWISTIPNLTLHHFPFSCSPGYKWPPGYFSKGRSESIIFKYTHVPLNLHIKFKLPRLVLIPTNWFLFVFIVIPFIFVYSYSPLDSLHHYLYTPKSTLRSRHKSSATSPLKLFHILLLEATISSTSKHLQCLIYTSLIALLTFMLKY